MDYYLQQPMLLWLNLLAPVLLIWLLYFLIGRCWAAYLLTALPVLGIALANFYKMQLRGRPAAGLRSQAGQRGRRHRGTTPWRSHR